MGHLYTITPTEQQARDLESKASQHMLEAGFTVHLKVTQMGIQSTAEIRITSIEAYPDVGGGEPRQLLMRGTLLNGKTAGKEVTVLYNTMHIVGMYATTGSGSVIVDNAASLDTGKTSALLSIIGRMMSTYITHRVASIDEKMINLHVEAQKVFLATDTDKLNALRKDGPN